MEKLKLTLLLPGPSNNTRQVFSIIKSILIWERYCPVRYVPDVTIVRKKNEIR